MTIEYDYSSPPYKDSVLTFDINTWRLHQMDRAAGPRRNRNMLESNPGAVVVAFDGGKGTENCIAQAQELGHVVLRVL